MPMSADYESEIRLCLAYEVLRDPDPWIGSPSTAFLQAFLCGAQIRADFVRPTLPDWRVSGVLDDPVFYKQFLDATGHPTLSIKWATALEFTHFSLADGFNTLKTAALAYHRAHGVSMAHLNNTNLIAEKTAEDVEQFWTAWSKRPMMYMGGICGWTLYCFLNGMDRGGDWLQLPERPRLRDLFGGIKAQSIEKYGSPFAAFRLLNAKDLLAWVGMNPDA